MDKLVIHLHGIRKCFEAKPDNHDTKDEHKAELKFITSAERSRKYRQRLKQSKTKSDVLAYRLHETLGCLATLGDANNAARSDFLCSWEDNK